MESLIACETCDLVQRVDPVPKGMLVRCARCGSKLFGRKIYSRERTLAFSIAALILYLPANMLPIATAEYMGTHTEETIWDGVHSLFMGGNYFVAGLVFTTSILTPLLKILGMIFVAAMAGNNKHQRLKTRVYKIIEAVNPWNMLEVYMLAVLVGIVEMGKVATVHPGAGVISFASLVFLTNCASISFDPRIIWDPPLKEERKVEYGSQGEQRAPARG